MHWQLWDVQLNGLIDTFDTESEALEGVRDLLAVNAPDYVDFLALGAMYDEGESRDVELPPVLEGETLKSRLAEMAQQSASEASREVHERIRQWLTEEKWTIQDESSPHALLSLVVTLSTGQTMSIMQARELSGSILIVKQLVFDDSFRSDFSQFPIEVQREIVWNVHRDLSLLGVEFDGPGLPPMEMRFYAPIYLDGLTKDALMQRILLVNRALSLTIWIFARGVETAGHPDAASELLRLVPRAGNSSGPGGPVMAAS
jgi:hypothetical protein